MDTFKILFGTEKSAVHRNCVLLPVPSRELSEMLGLSDFSKGKLYACAHAKRCTAIRTGIGPAFAGDAVLHLADTPCENIILFGSCGLTEPVGNLRIGSLVAPTSCYSAESFTELLRGDVHSWEMYNSNKSLRDLLRQMAGGDLQDATCISIGSLKLQEDKLPLLKEKGIDLLDMECASVFAAAAHIGRRAAALFYITDIVRGQPFYANMSKEDRSSLTRSIRSAATLVCEFIEKKLSD
ncbi:MAG: hypothetical protein NTZ78_01620 [Candidatus Aureabacteria bacterium]|nr:hypothetical protein [Candidatus Auribacterota bacterium]